MNECMHAFIAYVTFVHITESHQHANEVIELVDGRYNYAWHARAHALECVVGLSG